MIIIAGGHLFNMANIAAGYIRQKQFLSVHSIIHSGTQPRMHTRDKRQIGIW